jgi:hypothetical protein
VVRGSWAFIVVLLLAGFACAHGRRSTAAADAQPVGTAVGVEVTNNYGLPMEVDAVGSGIRRRMGTVHPGMSGHFVLPPAMVGNGLVEFQAHPTVNGREVARSGELLLAPGQVVDFVIAPQLFNSTATVRP